VGNERVSKLGAEIGTVLTDENKENGLGFQFLLIAHDHESSAARMYYGSMAPAAAGVRRHYTKQTNRRIEAHASNYI